MIVEWSLKEQQKFPLFHKSSHNSIGTVPMNRLRHTKKRKHLNVNFI